MRSDVPDALREDVVNAFSYNATNGAIFAGAIGFNSIVWYPNAIPFSTFPAAIIFAARLLAASRYTESFNNTSACNGVFVRIRRAEHTSRAVPSKLIMEG